MDEAKQLILDDAIRVAIEAKRENQFMWRIIIALSVAVVILSATVLYLV